MKFELGKMVAYHAGTGKFYDPDGRVYPYVIIDSLNPLKFISDDRKCIWVNRKDLSDLVDYNFEYMRLSSEQKYYLEKCYTYLSKNTYGSNPRSVIINNDHWDTRILCGKLNGILSENLYHTSQSKLLNGMAEYYSDKILDEKLRKRHGH